jgi:hypothetical protein
MLLEKMKKKVDGGSFFNSFLFLNTPSTHSRRQTLSQSEKLTTNIVDRVHLLPLHFLRLDTHLFRQRKICTNFRYSDTIGPVESGTGQFGGFLRQYYGGQPGTTHKRPRPPSDRISHRMHPRWSTSQDIHAERPLGVEWLGDQETHGFQSFFLFGWSSFGWTFVFKF